MRRILFAAALAAVSAVPAGASWWAENDYAFGSNGLKKDSLTLYRKTSATFTSGLNASVYKDGAYDGVYSLRLPLMYSTPGYFVSLKPFYYPLNSDAGSSAYGGKLYYLTSVSEEQDESYLHLILSGAWAAQRAYVPAAAGPERKSFSESALEVQAEKSFYGQFYFLGAASGFTKPAGLPTAGPLKPVLDQADLAYLGTFRQVNALPEWALTAQLARNMRPDYDSNIYAGYSRISFRNAGKAGSFVTGIKMNLNEKSTLDMGYNAFKAENAAWKSYYKLLLQLFF